MDGRQDHHRTYLGQLTVDEHDSEPSAGLGRSGLNTYVVGTAALGLAHPCAYIVER